MSKVITKLSKLVINLVDFQEISDHLKNDVLGRKGIQIVTLNPEMVVEAEKNRIFREAIRRKSCWVVLDGIGIIFVLRFLSVCNKKAFSKKLIPKRITGIDLIYELAKNLKTEGRFFLFGGASGVAKKVSINLQKLFPYIKIVGTESGYNFADEKIIKKVNKSKSNILFVATGSPKQEMWISKNLDKMPNIKLAVGVGGAFDYISGEIKRAPLLVRKIGLEWFWRLLRQPGRIKRIFKAVVVFPYIIFRENFLNS